MIEEAFLKYSADKLSQLRERIHDSTARLTEDQMWMRNTESENAVGNVILHLAGNVRQWIGFGVAGQPDTRKRDAEFQARGGLDKAALLARLDESVDGALATVKALTPADLARMTAVQNYNITVMEAIYHVIEHFSGHTGQILFATKLLTGEDLGYYRHLSRPAHHETTP